MEAKIAEKAQKGAAESGMSLASAMGADATISDHLLFHTEAEADPRALVDGYGALRDWAHNSLDLYKVGDVRAREGDDATRRGEARRTRRRRRARRDSNSRVGSVGEPTRATTR